MPNFGNQNDPNRGFVGGARTALNAEVPLALKAMTLEREKEQNKVAVSLKMRELQLKEQDMRHKLQQSVTKEKEKAYKLLEDGAIEAGDKNIYDLVQRQRLSDYGINPNMLPGGIMPPSDYHKKRSNAVLTHGLKLIADGKASNIDDAIKTVLSGGVLAPDPDKIDQKLYKTTEGLLPSSQAKGKTPFVSKGISMKSDGKGGFELTMGGGGGATGTDKVVDRKIQTNLLNVKESRERLEGIRQSYKPKFLQFETKFQALKTSLKEKYKGTKIPFTNITVDSLIDMDIPEKDKQELREFAAFRAEALENLNKYIHDMTGAQMSNQEAKRLRKALPDPGEGLFDGQSPSAFEATWKNMMHRLRMSEVRYVYYLKNGLVESPEALKRLIDSDAMMPLAGKGSISDKINDEIDKLVDDGVPEDEAVRLIKGKYTSIEG